MGQRTALFDLHVALGARLVDFSGWDMPLHYGSQVDEHHMVRSDCGIFDVSHMTVVDIHGSAAQRFLRYLLCNDIALLAAPGMAQYSAMLNERGGIIDDLIVYSLENRYRVVVNAATRAKDLAWMRELAARYDVIVEERPELAIIAVQGPAAIEKIAALMSYGRAALIRGLQRFQGMGDGSWFIARTGYTGEDGLEIILPASEASSFFNDMVGAGIGPAGLGARDTLRLEAGLNLYGQEMNETLTPLECNMASCVAFEPAERQFIGRDALLAQRAAGAGRRLVGLVLEDRGVIRRGQPVRAAGRIVGSIASGTYGPTLGKSIALACLPTEVGERAEVEIRGQWYPLRVVRPCFVRRGNVLI